MITLSSCNKKEKQGSHGPQAETDGVFQEGRVDVYAVNVPNKAVEKIREGVRIK